MNLARRIEQLENAAGQKTIQLPDMIVRFIDAVPGENGGVRPGPCTGGVRLAFGKQPQWLDADMQPVAGPS